MTDALQTIALACGFLPATVILWLRVSRLMREAEDLQRQALTAMLADDIRRYHRHDTHTRGGWRDYDAVN
jgi:hypothetical protein